MKEDGKKKRKKVAAKKSKAKKSAKDAKPSFLKRLLKRDGDSKKSKSADTTGAPAKKKPLTPLERSIAEIRQLQKVGERDPERLATLLANILAKEKAKQDEAREKFDAMVWDIVHREEQDDEDPGDDGRPADDTDESSQDKPTLPPDPSHN